MNLEIRDLGLIEYEAAWKLQDEYAREIAEANGWKRLATNSAKMVNILGGYGYRPMLASMEACVDAAESGRLV